LVDPWQGVIFINGLRETGRVGPRELKFVAPCPFADPEVAARKLVELANAVETKGLAHSTMI
jgi:hypothetical protein